MLQNITQPTPLKKIYGASLIFWSLSVKVEVDAGCHDTAVAHQTVAVVSEQQSWRFKPLASFHFKTARIIFNCFTLTR